MKRKLNKPQPPKQRRSPSSRRDMVDSGVMSDPDSQMKHLALMQHSNNVLKFLNEDRTKQRFCDLHVSVGGKQYSAHKVVLAQGSSYFHAELTKNPHTNHVTLDHVEESVFQHLLHFLYTSECVVSERELPALTKAARFLDMMDVVKLLTETEGPVDCVLAQAKTGVEPDVERNTEAPADGTRDQSQTSVQCCFCSRRFCYKKSLENHLAKSHICTQGGGTQGDSVVQNAAEGQVTTTARRSARRRKVPAKFKMSDNEATEANMDEPSQDTVGQETGPFLPEEEENKEEHDDRKQESKSPSGGASEDEEEREDEELEVENQRVIVETAEDQTGPEVEVYSQTSDSANHAPVYPEGLAPVIIHTASKKTLQCPKCDKTFDRIGKYESHTRVHTGEKPFQCDVCLQCYSTKSNLTVHKKKHDNDAPFQRKEHKCPFCSKLHASRKTLSKHVRRFHPDHIQEFIIMRKRKSEGWKCDICHKSFTRRPHLEEHMILHSQDRPFKCSFCDDYFKSRFARLKHQEKYHLGPFPCDICGRQFNDTGNRKRHIECTHGGKRKWTCFICGKSVRERTTLREHLRIHSGEKPHLCSICGQSFRHGSSYRLHLRVHHDDKRYECDECGKTFIRHDHLTKHQKIHSGEKAHQCEECGKCFRRHDHLTVHYKSVHLGEKVWQKYKMAVHQCEVCKKEFKGKSSLEMHFRTHSGEKPHKCPVCHQTFRIKKTLTKHMVIHSDARPFNCPHCSATFKRKDKLKYHMDHVHSTKFSEQPLTGTNEDKMAVLPYDEPPKVFPEEPKTIFQSATADSRVPVTLVPVLMSGVQGQGDLARHRTTISTQPHGVLTSPQAQAQITRYQAATDLAFLEKYTLTPQPANIVHPVRPDQMLDPRESYLGTLLGLDSAPTVQNISNSDHPH
ncbi:zinc finger and BTB domain-containing protein 41 [Osmerus eperlanus]|uniref:zinc finger and BTB domain-containing protein 41 n=1 Tax=Osmerus eperlanus TaxID=29151 RepID=UPI002E133C0A